MPWNVNASGVLQHEVISATALLSHLHLSFFLRGELNFFTVSQLCDKHGFLGLMVCWSCGGVWLGMVRGGMDALGRGGVGLEAV